jgi:hypothetical protein
MHKVCAFNKNCQQKNLYFDIIEATKQTKYQKRRGLFIFFFKSAFQIR